MKLKTKSRLLQAPAMILLIAAFVASFVIKIMDTYPITWGTPILLLIILVLYFWGRYIEKQAYRNQ